MIQVKIYFFSSTAEQPVQQAPGNPCIPSPCGPNSQCKVSGDSPSCSCLPDFLGVPPSCRPECVSNGECSSHLACIRQKCTDPCPNTCGTNAICRVVSHTPQCLCSPGFTGDPFVQCTPIQRKFYNLGKNLNLSTPIVSTFEIFLTYFQPNQSKKGQRLVSRLHAVPTLFAGNRTELVLALVFRNT